MEKIGKIDENFAPKSRSPNLAARLWLLGNVRLRTFWNILFSTPQRRRFLDDFPPAVRFLRFSRGFFCFSLFILLFITYFIIYYLFYLFYYLLFNCFRLGVCFSRFSRGFFCFFLLFLIYFLYFIYFTIYCWIVFALYPPMGGVRRSHR